MGAKLLVAAKKHELKGLRKNKVMLSQLSALETPLNDVYGIHRPSSQDYANRRDLIRIFNEIAREIYGNNDKCPVLEEFGSFLMDMFNAESDLDLSINFNDKKFEFTRGEKIKALQKFAKKFYVLQKRGHVTDVKPIMKARVPVLKVTDCGTGIECDLSVGNMDGIVKSHIVRMISAIDERFQKLSFLMKAWAKAHDINSSKDGTLNSLSLILLAAFHLQTRDIPVLPPFSAIFKDGTNPMAVKKSIPSFLNYGEKNKESLAELFVSLLIKLESVETLWLKGLCASIYEGSWIHKTWNPVETARIGCINIEDFTDRSQNTARAVKSGEIKKIYSCIHQSLQQIRSFTEGKTDVVKLKNQLFGADPLTTTKVTTSINHRTLLQPVIPKPTSRKRKRPTKGALAEGQKQTKKPGKSCQKPCINKAPTPSRSHVGEKKLERTHHETSENVISPLPSTSFQELVKSQETLRETWCQPLARSNHTIQGSGGCRPERVHVETSSHAASVFQANQPLSVSHLPVQGSGGFRSQRTSFETLGRATPNFPAGVPLSNLPIQGSGGFKPEITHIETLSHASQYFPSGQPFALSNPPIQGYGGFRPQRTHVDILSHPASNFRVHQPNSNLPIRGSEGLHSGRIHVETFSHATSNFSASVRYPLTSRSNSVMPPHVPCPPVHRTNPMGLERSYEPQRSLLFVRRQFQEASHAPDDRDIRGHRAFQPLRYPSSSHFGQF